jgi:hypothetical protein
MHLLKGLWENYAAEVCLITHNTHKRQTSMLPAGFELAFPSNERSEIHTLDRAANGIGCSMPIKKKRYFLVELLWYREARFASTALLLLVAELVCCNYYKRLLQSAGLAVTSLGTTALEQPRADNSVSLRKEYCWSGAFINLKLRVWGDEVQKSVPQDAQISVVTRRQPHCVLASWRCDTLNPTPGRTWHCTWYCLIEWSRYGGVWPGAVR